MNKKLLLLSALILQTLTITTSGRRAPVVTVVVAQPGAPLPAGAVRVVATDITGNTGLHIAAKAGNRKRVEELLANPITNPFAKNDAGQTAYEVATGTAKAVLLIFAPQTRRQRRERKTFKPGGNPNRLSEEYHTMFKGGIAVTKKTAKRLQRQQKTMSQAQLMRLAAKAKTLSDSDSDSDSDDLEEGSVKWAEKKLQILRKNLQTGLNNYSSKRSQEKYPRGSAAAAAASMDSSSDDEDGETLGEIRKRVVAKAKAKTRTRTRTRTRTSNRERKQRMMYVAGPASGKAHSDYYLSMYGAKGRCKAQAEIYRCELTPEMEAAVLQANLLAKQQPLTSYSREKTAPRKSLAHLEEQIKLLEEDPHNAIAEFTTGEDLLKAEKLVEKRRKSQKKDTPRKKKKTKHEKRLDSMFGSSEEDE